MQSIKGDVDGVQAGGGLGQSLPSVRIGHEPKKGSVGRAATDVFTLIDKQLPGQHRLCHLQGKRLVIGRPSQQHASKPTRYQGAGITQDILLVHHADGVTLTFRASLAEIAAIHGKGGRPQPGQFFGQVAGTTPGIKDLPDGLKQFSQAGHDFRAGDDVTEVAAELAPKGKVGFDLVGIKQERVFVIPTPESSLGVLRHGAKGQQPRQARLSDYAVQHGDSAMRFKVVWPIVALCRQLMGFSDGGRGADMLDPMQIPERYLQKINPLVAHARSLVEKGETLAALAFIGNMTTDQVIPMVLDDSSDEAKDSSALGISRAAAMLEADFIFQVREAWMLPQRYVDRHQEILDEYGSVGASPYAQDIAAFSLETTHGTWIATVPLKAKPPSKKRRTFGAVEFRHMPQVEGRFVGLC